MRNPLSQALSRLARQRKPPTSVSIEKKERPDASYRKGALFVLGGAAAVVAGTLLIQPWSDDAQSASPVSGKVDASEQPVSVTAPELGLVVDEDVDYDSLDEQAKENAQRLYDLGQPARLNFFSPKSLSTISLESDEDPLDNLTAGMFGRVGSAPIVRVFDTQESEAKNTDVERLYEQVARSLGSYRRNSIRPAALQSAIEFASWHLIAGVEQNDVSSSEKRQQQIAFLTSGRLGDIKEKMGGRIFNTWEPPESRFITDGAVASVVLNDGHSIQSMSIERSTGRNAYDQSVMEALYQSAPFSEINELQPWLRDTMGTLLFSFGTPPASPEEFRRREQAGELSLFRGLLDPDSEKQSGAFLLRDHFQDIQDSIADELKVLNAIRWKGKVERDVILHIDVSTPLGVVMDVHIEHGSGDFQFDRLAVEAVDNASPFRDIRHLPPSEQTGFEKFAIHVHPGGVR